MFSTIIAILASISGVVLGLANFPQAIKIFKLKDARDISVITYGIVFVGGIIWVVYGININNLPILVSNSLGLIANTLVLIGIFKYSKK